MKITCQCNVTGTDEGAFISVFCSNSYEQLRAIFHEYRALAGHDIMDAINNEMSGDLKDALLAIGTNATFAHIINYSYRHVLRFA